MNRRSQFRSDVNKAYMLICERKIVDDAEIQYILNLSHASFYRLKKALLAIFPDVVHEHGFFKLKEEKMKSIIEHWGELTPEKK